MAYLGDFRLGDTFDTKFCTRQISGAPFTLAGSPVISAYVGNSTTQITAGITLTVDFDSVTGLNNVRVVASGGNGYATASNYQLVITTGTVNSVSVVGEVIAEFSIENRSALMPTTATRTLDVSAGGEAGVDWANVGSPSTSVNLSATTTNVVNTASAVTAVSSGGISEASFATTAGSFYPMGVIDQGTAQAVGATSFQARSAASFGDDMLNGCTVVLTNGTYAGLRGVISDYTGATDTAVIAWAGGITPSGTPTYKIYGSAEGASLAQIATAVWQDSTSGDFTVASSIGKALYVSNVAPGGSGGHMISGSNSGTTTLAALTVSGATTLTGAVSATNASNDIVGIDVTKISGDATAANNAESFFDGTGYAGTNNVIPLVTTTTTATNLTNAPTAGDFTATMKTSIGTAVAASAVASVTGNVGGNVTGSVGSLAAQAKADVNAEVLDVLVTDTFAEPASVPAATASLKDKIGWQAVIARNKITQTATTQLVRNDADNATIGTSTVSDDGTTAIRGEFA